MGQAEQIRKIPFQNVRQSMRGLVILVAGGRDLSREDAHRLEVQLTDIDMRAGITLLIHGNSRGADTVADDWATSRCIHTARIRALWSVEPVRAAGIRRNATMARLAPAIDLAVFAPGGRGTADMVGRMTRLGIPVWQVDDPFTHHLPD